MQRCCSINQSSSSRRAMTLTLLVVALLGMSDLVRARVAAPPRSTMPPATPTPTWPMPNFTGYIALAQYVCDDLLCPDWSLTVTRLATECFTWDCQYEEKQMRTLVPKSPKKDMEFNVLTAQHAASRTFYTVGITDEPPASAVLWATHIDKSWNGTRAGASTMFLFPNLTNTLVSMEVSANGTVLAIFRDGAIAAVDPTTGAVTVLGFALSNSSRVLNQATAFNIVDDHLYCYSDVPQGGQPGFETFDLKSLKVVASVPLQPLPSTTIPQSAFELTWIPTQQQLMMFSTGLFDQLIYVDPKTGASMFYVEDLMQYNQLGFNVDPGSRSDDTYKNNAYDDVANVLYFQASVYSQEGDVTTSLAATAPFPPGSSPAPAYWINVALSPVDFGYQGMHFLHCHDGGRCPT